jgi:dihydroneopterin aldolase
VLPDLARLGLAQSATAASVPVVEISVTGIQVAADIGVFTHEHGRTQPLVVDIVLHVDAPARDALEETVDYQLIANDAHDLARERTALIETYAIRLARKCIAYRGARSVEIRVSKPGALNDGLAGTRVSLAR